jgi:hypothetical protein
VEEKKRELKKFFHDYMVATIATVLLILLLALMLLSRYSALAGINDLSKINPLITSGKNKLTAQSDTNGVVKISKDDIGSNQDATSNTNGGTITGSQSGQNNTPSGGASSGVTSTPAPSPVVFAASIGQMRHFASNGTNGLNACRITHDFQADIIGTNAPGTVTYRWSRSDGTVEQPQQMAFQAGDSLKTATYSWAINGASANYSVTIELLSPTKTQKTLEFQHSCSLLEL